MRTTLIKHSELSSLSNSEFNQRFGDKLAITLRELKPWIVEAHRRIESGELVQGCKTKGQLASLIGRTPDAIYKTIHGRPSQSIQSIDAPIDSEQDKPPIEMVPAYEAKREPPQSGPTCDLGQCESTIIDESLNVSFPEHEPYTERMARKFLLLLTRRELQLAYRNSLINCSDPEELQRIWEYFEAKLFKGE